MKTKINFTKNVYLIHVFIISITVAISVKTSHAQNQEIFSVGSIEAKSGEKVPGKLIVEDGILYTFPDRGQYITQGTLIGYTTDYWGNVLEEYHSPLTGLVLSLKVAPSINKGEKVCSIVEILDKFEE